MTIREHVGPRVLLVDDDPDRLRMDAFEIELYGWSVVTAGNPIEAIATMAEETIDLAILDYNMPIMNGCALAKRLRSSFPDLIIVLHSAALDIPRWEMNSVDAFISKADGLMAFLPRFAALWQQGIDRYPPDAPQTGSSFLEHGAQS
jgi:CheY-like chemotaxis protein